MAYPLKYRRDAAAHEKATGFYICCPQCFGRSILHRKKAKNWWCRRCGHEFTKPLTMHSTLLRRK